MGNSNQNAIPLAILKRPDFPPYDQRDYEQFFNNKERLISTVYDSFE